MRYCLALDLVDNQQLIEEYERHHRDVWPGRPGSHPQSRSVGHGDLQAWNATHDGHGDRRRGFQRKRDGASRS